MTGFNLGNPTTSRRTRPCLVARRISTSRDSPDHFCTWSSGSAGARQRHGNFIGARDESGELVENCDSVALFARIRGGRGTNPDYVVGLQDETTGRRRVRYQVGQSGAADLN